MFIRYAECNAINLQMGVFYKFMDILCYPAHIYNVLYNVNRNIYKVRIQVTNYYPSFIKNSYVKQTTHITPSYYVVRGPRSASSDISRKECVFVSVGMKQVNMKKQVKVNKGDEFIETTTDNYHSLIL